MFLSEPLPKTTRWGILLVGFLLGVVLYFTDWDREGSIGQTGGKLVFSIQMLAVAFAVVTGFVVTRFNAMRFWGLVLLPLPFVALMSGWVSWSTYGLERWARHDVVLAWQCALAVMLFLALPWLQGRLLPGNGWGSWGMFYAQLWRNGITLLLSGLLTLVFWGILALWAGLFKLVDITLFDSLFFDSPSFAWIASCVVIAAAIVLCRERYRAIRAIQHFFTLLATGLLPLLSLISLMFLATLPFVGLGSISQHVSCNALLNTLTLMVMATASGVYHPERDARPYPGRLEKAIKLALLLSPAYALLAGYALWLRVSAYGWTPSRVYAALITLTVLVWALGYAVTLIRQRGEAILQPGGINRAVLLLALALLVAVNSPILDPYRISVNNQMARYHAGKLKADNLSLWMLQSSGRRGYEALRALQKEEAFTDNPERRRELAMLLSESQSASMARTPLTVVFLRQHVELADKNREPEEAWWQAMTGEEGYRVKECLGDGDRCLLVGMDLNGDGQDEWLLCQPEMSYCTVYGKAEKGWNVIGQVQDPDNNQVMASLKHAASQGKLTAAPKAWQDIMVEGRRVTVDYYRQ